MPPTRADGSPAGRYTLLSEREGDLLEVRNQVGAFDTDSGAVKRGLKNRHLSMIAIGGVVGPGLLVGSGGALHLGGPASLLIGFGIMGVIAFSVMQSLGEMTTLYPGGGAFISLADRVIEKPFAVAVGWTYFIIWATVLANEYNIISSIFGFWSDAIPVWGYFAIFWSAFTGFQLLGVEAFGEAEFWLALIKIVGLATYFVFASLYASTSIGFEYWRDPGPFNGNGFRGLATVFVYISTFYAGCESVSIAAGETRNPGVAVPQAIRQIFWRIIFIYLGSAFFFGLTCPANAPGLVDGTARSLKSPMTIALQLAGWHSSVHLINMFIFVTCLSAVNSAIYFGSRTILYMAQNGKAPRFLSSTNSRGVPFNAILLTNCFGALALLNVSKGASVAYAYIVNLSGVGTFIAWASISFIHIRFRKAWYAQGRTETDLPFKALWYPWNAYFGLAANLFLALAQGWTTLSPFDASKFVNAYVLLPLFALVYYAAKSFMRTTVRESQEVDLDSGRRSDLDNELDSLDDKARELSWWRKAMASF